MNKTAARTRLTKRILTSSKQDASLLGVSILWPSIVSYGSSCAGRFNACSSQNTVAGPKSVGRQDTADAGRMRAATRKVNINICTNGREIAGESGAPRCSAQRRFVTILFAVIDGYAGVDPK